MMNKALSNAFTHLISKPACEKMEVEIAQNHFPLLPGHMQDISQCALHLGVDL